MHRAFPSGQLVELADGGLVVPWYGYQSEQDLLDHHYSNVLARSHDGGMTWGDWSVIASDPLPVFSYCEPALLARPDGRRTWSEPKPSVVGSQPAVVPLPGGEMAFVVRSTGRQSNAVYFSRDLGETWDYALEGAYNTWMAGLLDGNALWVWANTEALIYRRGTGQVPACRGRRHPERPSE